jgi:hypothetical protein
MIGASFAFEGQYGIGFSKISTNPTIAGLSQANIIIPTGTTLDIKFKVKLFRSPSCVFYFILDSKIIVSKPQPVGSMDQWITIGTDQSPGVAGVCPGDLHDIALRISCPGGATKPTFNVDNVSMTAISGPNGLPLCA